MADLLQAFIAALETIPGIELSGLVGVGLVLVLLVSYAVYLILSIVILSFSLKFLGVEKVPYKQVLLAVIVRDLVSAGLVLIPLGIGAVISFVIWIGIIKYYFKLDWGKAVVVAIVAELIPLGILIVLFSLGIIGLLFFL